MIVSDFSKVFYSVVHVFSDDIKKSSPQEIEDLLRHAVINSFITLKKKFTREYGELVIVLDGNKNFRYGIFPNYKFKRKENRDKSDFPWHIIFNIMSKLQDEARDNWPWRIVKSDFSEADDCMAVLVEDVANKNFIQVGLNEEQEHVLLDTRDHDMFQLLKYPNVRQWDSVDKKFKKQKQATVAEFLRDLILLGDKGDGVCNVFSHEDCFVNDIRQTAAIASRVATIIKHESLFDYDDNPEIKRRILQNWKLVCFDAIPLHVREDILKSYNASTKKPKLTMLKYLQKNRCKMLIDHIEEM